MGCGPRKRISDAITTDLLDYECVDIVGESFSVLRHFPDDSVDYVYSYHFVEHLPDLGLYMEEMQRILEALNREEKKVQDKMKKVNLSNKNKNIEKDW